VECDSLELRHWPLPPELEAVTRELLSLIAYTKERVLLAMSLFVMHVTNYVDVMYGELFYNITCQIPFS
jgi:hypothetical protein